MLNSSSSLLRNLDPILLVYAIQQTLHACIFCVLNTILFGEKSFWALLHDSVVNLMAWSSEPWLEVPATLIQPWVTLHLTLTQILHVF